MKPYLSRVPQSAGVVLLTLLLSACPKASAPEADQGEAAVPVAVAPVIRGRITATYPGTATIEARSEAVVVAKIAGVIRQIDVEEGQHVDASAELARIEDERLQLELDRARAQHQKLSKELERQGRLFRQQLISRDEFDRKRFELAAAKAELALADLNLRESVIRTPIAGVISDRLVKRGNMVQPNQQLFRVTDLGVLEAALNVPERDMHKLGAGQPVKLTVDSWPDRIFAGRVQRISPVIDAQTGTVPVTITLENDAGRLRPGMFARFRVVYDEKPAALLIPKDAVTIEDAAASVFVISQDKARRRAVRLGYSDASRYEVLEGLDEGELVVTTGRASLKDGAPTEIVDTRD